MLHVQSYTQGMCSEVKDGCCARCMTCAHAGRRTRWYRLLCCEALSAAGNHTPDVHILQAQLRITRKSSSNSRTQRRCEPCISPWRQQQGQLPQALAAVAAACKQCEWLVDKQQQAVHACHGMLFTALPTAAVAAAAVPALLPVLLVLLLLLLLLFCFAFLSCPISCCIWLLYMPVLYWCWLLSHQEPSSGP